MEPLHGTSTGHKMIVMALAFMAMGSLMLKKIVSFKG
jgi:Flp pilus assembly protein TadB